MLVGSDESWFRRKRFEPLHSSLWRADTEILKVVNEVNMFVLFF